MHKNLKKTNKNIDYVLNKSQKCFSMLKSLNNILNNPSINIQININDSLNKIEKLINYMKKLKNNLKKLKNLIIDSKKQGKNIDLLFSETNSILLEINGSIDNLKGDLNDIHETLKNMIEMSYIYYNSIPKLT